MAKLKTFPLNTWGQVLTVNTYSDLSGATELSLIFRKPDDGTVVTKTTADGVSDSGTPTDGKLIYTIEDGLLDTVGEWKVIGRLDHASRELESDPPARFVVVNRFQN